MNLLPLLLFNDRVERLENSRFLKWLFSGSKQPDYKEISIGSWLSYSGLHPDDLTAFCTNLRMLTLNPDGFSLACVAKVYESLPDTFLEAKALIEKECQELNEFLRQKSFIQAEGERVTNEEFLKIIIYANIVHGKQQHDIKFRHLTSQVGVFFSVTFHHLIDILLHHRNCFSRVASINQVIINNLQVSND